MIITFRGFIVNHPHSPPAIHFENCQVKVKSEVKEEKKKKRGDRQEWH
jgi:hypothetical protein